MPGVSFGRTQGTVFFTLALFIGLEIIWEPFNYTLVFGAFDSGFPNALFNAGMLKMIYNSIQQNLAPEKRDLKPALRPARLERSGVGTA